MTGKNNCKDVLDQAAQSVAKDECTNIGKNFSIVFTSLPEEEIKKQIPSKIKV